MSHVLGIGVDVVEVERITTTIRRFGDRFLDRIFTAGEQEYCRRKAYPAEHLAARFAAKEAVLKALGTGWTGQAGFQDVEIVRAANSAPQAVLSLRVRRLLPPGAARVWLSISHTERYALAQALITIDDDAHRSV